MGIAEFVMLFISAVGGVIWYLLRQKDANQEHEIRLLFIKCDAMSLSVQDLRLTLAGRHYEKTELDSKFDKLELAFKDGFETLGARFDKLGEILLDRKKKK